MYYPVEIQRQAGHKLAEPVVEHGQLNTHMRAFGQRTVVMLQLTDTGSVHSLPTLYNPVLIKATHEGMAFSGMEQTADNAWVAQSWWCAYSTPEAAVAASGSDRPRR